MASSTPALVNPAGTSVPGQATEPGASVAGPTGKPANGNDAAKLKIEIMRLEGLIKKLQSELQAEREYARSLESHVRSLQETAR
jgi:hypothetical protein